MILKFKKNIPLILVILIYISYFIGFYFGENSIGAGGYDGDLTWIWNNFEIFKNNKLIEAINHQDFFGNRTPLLYILNVYINPFINNIDTYRASLTILSLLGPFIFYLCLKKKFRNYNKQTLLLISSLLLLSPFYRSNAYWGGEINYGILTTLISFFYFISIYQSKNIKFSKDIFLLIFFSSITVYFDQKLLIVPLIAYISLILKKNKKIIILSTLLFFVFALPFCYLIFIWNGIVPRLTQLANPNTVTTIKNINNFYFYNIGYAASIIAFYLIPFILLKKEKVFGIVKNFFTSKQNKYLIFVPLVYIILLIIFYDFKNYTVDTYWIGFGILHKISKYLFQNIIYQEFFTYISMVISFYVIFIILEKKIFDYLVITYLFVISLLLWPLMQEYFDPILLIFFLLIFKTKFYVKLNAILLIVIYYIIFLVGSNMHYYKLLN